MHENNTDATLSNFTKISLGDYCNTPQTFTTWNEFFTCYRYFATQSLVQTVFELILIASAIALNIFVTCIIYFNSISWSVFDQILIGHCFIQGLTALVDVPFFHLQDIFGYWPMPKVMSYFWASYDNIINTTCNLTMLYMCWARYRSVAVPTTFKNEILIKHPVTVMASIWAIGLTIWTPITIRYNNLDFSSNLNYDPVYLQNIFNTLFWLVPLLLILYFRIHIILILNKRSRNKSHKSNLIHIDMPMNATVFPNQVMARKTEVLVANGSRPMIRRTSSCAPPNSNKRKSSRKRMQPQVRYLLIILIYWTQWFIPCVAVLVNGLCNCIPNSVYVPIYWLT
jgi:hypothetical protein